MRSRLMSTADVKDALVVRQAALKVASEFCSLRIDLKSCDSDHAGRTAGGVDLTLVVRKAAVRWMNHRGPTAPGNTR